MPLHYLWRLARRPSPWPRRFLGTCARIAGARATSAGTPLARDALYLANHQSWLDILALAGASGTAFVAKAEVGRTPFIGWLAGMNNTVYVARQERMDVAAQIERVRTALAGNQPVTVFPEGTTTDGSTLLPFKTAMLRILEPPPAGVMVQPVLLDYGRARRDITWVGAESGLANIVRVLSRKGGFHLDIHFLEPLDPADHPGRKRIAAEAHRRIAGALATTLDTEPADFGR